MQNYLALDTTILFRGEGQGSMGGARRLGEMLILLIVLQRVEPMASISVLKKDTISFVILVLFL
jgi:hypothetical protein